VSRLIALALTAALVSLPAGCGHGGGPPSNELVRYAVKDSLDFRDPAEKGKGSLVKLDDVTVVYRDGTGTRTSAVFRGTRKFRVSQAELDQLNGALRGLDLKELQRRFPAREGDSGRTVLTYNGVAATLGDGLAEAHDGDEQADRFDNAAELLDRFGARALPPSVKRAGRRAARDTEREIRKLQRLTHHANPR
jgi:hypothetical protein